MTFGYYLQSDESQNVKMYDSLLVYKHLRFCLWRGLGLLYYFEIFY